MIKCPSCLRVNQGGTPNCIHCGAIIGSQIWWGRLLSGIKSFFTRFVPKTQITSHHWRARAKPHTDLAPAALRAEAQADIVLPVVTTSSSRRILRPSTSPTH